MLNTFQTSLAQDLSEQQQSLLHGLSQQIEQLNASMREAVNGGLSIELQRSSRHHKDGGFWGDIIAPNVVKKA
jgi:hypothetical protein